jgi:hypothetical protein
LPKANTHLASLLQKNDRGDAANALRLIDLDLGAVARARAQAAAWGVAPPDWFDPSRIG